MTLEVGLLYNAPEPTRGTASLVLVFTGCYSHIITEGLLP